MNDVACLGSLDGSWVLCFVFLCLCGYTAFVLAFLNYLQFLRGFCAIKGGLVYEGMSGDGRIEKGVGMKGI